MAFDSRRLPGSDASEQLQRIDHLAIGRDARIGDDRLDLVAREHGLVPPLGILVGERPELALVEHTRRLLDQVGELRVAEHRRDHVHFLVWAGADLKVVYRVRIGGESAPPVVEIMDPPIALAAHVRGPATALHTARKTPVPRVDALYNDVVLPAELIGEAGWLVYALAATTNAEEMLVGGHTRIKVSADGTTVEGRERQRRRRVIAADHGLVTSTKSSPATLRSGGRAATWLPA